ADLGTVSGGPDGSRSIATARVDATGTGKNLPKPRCSLTDPTTHGTQPNISVKLPAGNNCTGGASEDLCLASFTTTTNF
ncbi:hypothetical protein BJV77DRAFT_925255, partial [Russula vinacea]